MWKLLITLVVIKLYVEIDIFKYIATYHSADFDYKDFMNTYKKFISEPH